MHECYSNDTDIEYVRVPPTPIDLSQILWELFCIPRSRYCPIPWEIPLDWPNCLLFFWSHANRHFARECLETTKVNPSWGDRAFWGDSEIDLLAYVVFFVVCSCLQYCTRSFLSIWNTSIFTNEVSVEGFFYFKTFVIWLLLLVRASLCNVRLLKNFISFRSVDREIPSSQLHRKLLLIIPLYVYICYCMFSAERICKCARRSPSLSLSYWGYLWHNGYYYCILLYNMRQGLVGWCRPNPRNHKILYIFRSTVHFYSTNVAAASSSPRKRRVWDREREFIYLVEKWYIYIYIYRNIPTVYSLFRLVLFQSCVPACVRERRRSDRVSYLYSPRVSFA